MLTLSNSFYKTDKIYLDAVGDLDMNDKTEIVVFKPVDNNDGSHKDLDAMLSSISFENFPVNIERQNAVYLTLINNNTVEINWEAVEKMAKKPSSPYDLILSVFCKALWAVKESRINETSTAICSPPSNTI